LLLIVVEPGMGPRILLYIEDDDAAFLLVKIILDEQAPDIRLLRARDGDEALRLLLAEGPDQQTLRPDLILLDLNLPKKHGLRVLSDLKAIESLREIPIVMFSTSSAAADKTAALHGGAQDYVTKPSSFDLFVEAVKMACSLP
jgi:DNA-binding response OmpR family regulator